MKKILLIALVVAMVLSLCTGCSKTRVIYDDDFDDEPITISVGGVPEEEPDDPVVEEPEDPVVEEPDDPVVDEPDEPDPTPTPTPAGPVSEELPNVWPVDLLPEGFPEYPDGEIYRVKTNVETYHDDFLSLYICISESSTGSYKKYRDALKSAGWTLEDLGEARIENQAGYFDYECWSFTKDGVYGVVEFYNPDGIVEIEIH